jgi:two-component system chemotaxis response regulator CheB
MKSERTSLTCPDCGGAIEKVQEGSMLQYRCRVGHAYSAYSALISHTEREENTLWTAVVLLQEGAELVREIADEMKDESAKDLRNEATAKRELAERVRQVVLELPTASARHAQVQKR